MASPLDLPRSVALDILTRVTATDAYAEPLLDAALENNRVLDRRDRAFITELVYGTLRWRGRLDWAIRSASNVPLDRIEPDVLDLMRMAAYQILFLDRVPDSAAVDESVEMVKTRSRGKRAAGFVNAILRRIAREKDRIAWPEAASDPAGYLSVILSHPDWLARRLAEDFGPEAAARLCEANLSIPIVFVRANTLKTDRDALARLLAGEGVDTKPCIYSPDGLVVIGAAKPVFRTDAFAQGLLYIQDEASQLVSRLLAPEPDAQVLEVCAAPGGKTTHLAQLMEGRGRIVAIDIHPRKLAVLAGTCGRLGIGSVLPLAADGAVALPLRDGEAFDAILVDAPCSGVGTLRRNPERKWRLDPAEIGPLARLQGRILRSAAERLKPGGVLVYSTCTLLREENEAVVEEFIEEENFELAPPPEAFPEECRGLVGEGGIMRTYPETYGMDGFFAARMRRR